MNENADTFVFYPSILEQIAQTKNKDIQNALFFAVSRYGCYGEIPDFSDIDKIGILDAAFLPMKILIDKAKANRRQKAEAGKKGGGQVGNQNAAKKRAETSRNEQNELNVNVNVNEDEFISSHSKEINVGKKTHEVRFKIPTLEEIKTFIQKNGFAVDADEFYSHYTANGWRIGINKMTNWEAAVRYWQSSHNHKGNDEDLSERTAADYNVSF